MKYPYTFEEYREEVMRQFKKYYPDLYTENNKDINETIQHDYNSSKKCMKKEILVISVIL